MGDLLYVGSCGGVFYAFDASTGAVRWSYDTSQDGSSAQFHGNPLTTEELVVTPTDATDEGYTYAFDLDSGELRWKQPCDGGGGIMTDLLRVGPNAVGVTRSGDLISFGLADGLVHWSFSGDATTYSESRPATPALAGDRIVFGALDGAVYAVEAETGKQLWKVDLGAPASSAIRVDGDSAFVGLRDYRLVRLKLADATPVWDVPVDGIPAGFPHVDGDTLVILAGMRHAAHDLVAIDTETGEERWKLSSEAPWSTVRLFPWPGGLLAGTEDGVLQAFRLRDGHVLWTLALGGRLRGMGSAGGRLFVGTIDGTLYALDRQKLVAP